MHRWAKLLFGLVLAFLLTGTMELRRRSADAEANRAVAEKQPGTVVERPAADGSLAYSPDWPEPPNTGAMLLRLFLGTAFVLVLCVASLWLGKPWLQKLQLGKPGSQAMQVEGTVMLGNRAVLYLVKVGDTQLVAGTDPTGLKSLIALPASFKEVLDAQIPTASPETLPVDSAFDLRLQHAAGQREDAA